MHVPSSEWPDARSALEFLLNDATSIRAAVAFVTGAGVDLLEQLLLQCPDAPLEIMARASDATEPNALLRLAERLNTEVSVRSVATPSRFIRSSG